MDSAAPAALKDYRIDLTAISPGMALTLGVHALVNLVQQVIKRKLDLVCLW